MTVSIKEIAQGGSANLVLKVRDTDGSSLPLDALPTIIIKDPSGSTADSGTMSLRSSGVYTYVFSSSSTAKLGTYLAITTAVESGNTEKTKFRFKVIC